MSHHGSQPFPESSEERAAREQAEKAMSARMRDLLGEYPDGKLNVQDEGALAIAVGQERGKVVIRFPKPVAWIGFTPEQALDIAQSLIDHARKIGLPVPLVIRLGGETKEPTK